MGSKICIGERETLVRWEQLPFAISMVTEQWLELEQRYPPEESGEGDTRTLSPPFLFRGQRESSWRLETSLERELNTNRKLRGIDEYFALVADLRINCKEKFPFNLQENTSWRSKPFPKLVELDQDSRNFLLYLRHYGFPSPLLDWSLDWQVAAFFAFSDTLPTGNGHVAIYMLGTKDSWTSRSSRPRVNVLGPLKDECVATSLTRHRRQQSCYSICTLRKFVDNKEVLMIARHDDEFSCISDDPVRDSNFLVHRFLIPHSEAGLALRDLRNEGINAEFLYQSACDTNPLEEQRLADAWRQLH